MEYIKEKQHISFSDVIEMDNPEFFLEQVDPFMQLMMQYRCALMEVETKLRSKGRKHEHTDFWNKEKL